MNKITVIIAIIWVFISSCNQSSSKNTSKETVEDKKEASKEESVEEILKSDKEKADSVLQHWQNKMKDK